MKRLVVIGVVFMLFMPSLTYSENTNHLFSFISENNGNNGKTLYVGGNGPNNYTSIQNAINDANDGDTIFVFNGTYYENIAIDKSIKIVGESKETTTIMGKKYKDVVSILAENVTIKNFTIKGCEMPETGIYVSTDRNKIINCILESDGIAIYMENANENMIFGCEISKNNDAIYLEFSSKNEIRRCFIHNNFEGISIENSCSNSIENCKIYSNDYYGINLFDVSNTSIYNSSIFKNGLGIGICCSLNVFIANCKLVNDGIRIDGVEMRHYIHKMENVTINGKPLLYFINQQGGNIQGDAGEILLINCSNFLIKNLSIENADVGIEIVYGQSNKIENCKIYGNEDCGVLAISSSYNEIYECRIKSKYGYGLHAINSFKNEICDNEFIKNGIQLLYSNNNSITNNTIDGKYNLQIGMRIDMSKRNFIAYNNITGCWDTGLVIASRLSIDKNIIYKNNFYRNGVHAIWIADSFANMIAENNFIEHPVTASFENAWNIWFHNYWDDWRAPIPKPIYGYIEGFYGTPLFPLINFDWNPALKPFGGRK